MRELQKQDPTANNIASVVMMLMGLGVVFVFSASAEVNRDIELSRFYHYPALRQMLFFPLAVIVMFAVSCFDYHHLSMSRGWYRSPATYLLIAGVCLSFLVLLPRFGAQINYARRWLQIPIGPARISFQPSELSKWAMVIFLAGFTAMYDSRLKYYLKGFIPICILVGMVAGLVLIEDFGTAALIAVLAFSILTLAGARWWHLMTPLPFAVIMFAVAIIRSPERCRRILAFMNPQQWTDSLNYQPSQSLIALGSGGIVGKGLGMGICKYGHLPEDTTDFIFAIIGEELGFVGTLSVIFLFAIFVWQGLIVIVRCRDSFGELLAAGIVLAISIQAALNIGVVTVLLPTKGIPLPFVSAGGTSLLLSAAAVGILINIAKQIPQRHSSGALLDEF